MHRSSPDPREEFYRHVKGGRVLGASQDSAPHSLFLCLYLIPNVMASTSVALSITRIFSLPVYRPISNCLHVFSTWMLT